MNGRRLVFSGVLLGALASVHCKGGPSTMPAEAAVEEILGEDRVLMEICSEIKPGRATQVIASGSDVLSPQAIEELRRELLADTRTLSASLGLGTQRCSDERRDAQACLEQIQERLLLYARSADVAAKLTRFGLDIRNGLTEAKLEVPDGELASATLRFGDREVPLSSLVERLSECEDGDPEQCLGRLESDITSLVGQPDLANLGAEELARKLQSFAALAKILRTREGRRQSIRSVLRNVDFSFIVVAKLAELGVAAERLIDESTASFGRFQGVARLFFRWVAAEVIASLNDSVLEALETREVVNRVAVGRRACSMWESGESRPMVATRLLKRMIARLSEDALAFGSHACTKTDLADSCAELNESIGGAGSLPPKATLGRTAPVVDRKEAKLKGESMRLAAGLCVDRSRSTECLRTLSSMIASHMRELPQGESISPEDLNALRRQVERLEASVGRIEKTTQDILAEQRELSAELGRVSLGLTSVGQMKEQISSVSKKVKVVEWATMQLLQRPDLCEEHLTNVRRTRLTYLSEERKGARWLELVAPGVEPNDSVELCPPGKKPSGSSCKTIAAVCAESESKDILRRFGSGDSAFEARVSVRDVCSGTLFSLGSLSMPDQFDSCCWVLKNRENATVAADNVISALEAAIEAAGPEQELLAWVGGHTSQRWVQRQCKPDPKSNRPRRDYCPKAKWTGEVASNVELSRLRAEAFDKELEKRLEAAAERTPALATLLDDPKGYGMERLAVDCKDDDTDACHKKNRRTTIEIRAEAFQFDVAKCGRQP